MKKLPKSLRKHIRKEKVRIKGQAGDNIGKEEIKNLYSKYYKKVKK